MTYFFCCNESQVSVAMNHIFCNESRFLLQRSSDFRCNESLLSVQINHVSTAINHWFVITGSCCNESLVSVEMIHCFKLQ